MKCLKLLQIVKLKKNRAELNRESKEAIKEAELQTKIQIEQAKIESVNERELARTISEMLKKQMDDDKEMDMAALENLVQLASEQMKEMTNDEEG